MAEPPAPIELVVAEEEAGTRLDRLLQARELGFSRSQLKAFIEEGRVEVDGAPQRASAKPAVGARIVLRPALPPPSAAIPQDIPLQILHEDRDLVVLLKPAGLVVHPAPGHPDGTLVNALRFHVQLEDGEGERPGIVHRLDRDTSGVMVVAKRAQAREGLIEQFKGHTIERAYEAIVLGHLPDHISYDPLHGRHPFDRKRFTTKVDRGKSAVTHVRTLQRLHGSSLIGCILETGRTHQIRVHLSEDGHPVLADPIYGRRPKDARLIEAGETIGRLALHARMLGFEHPITGEAMCFDAPAPEPFARAVEVLSE